jgi:preprotein translocase subunit SecE
MDDIENPSSPPAPRAAAFGEGAEGRGARRERSLSGPRTGPVSRLSHFVRDVRAEMKRVSWPDLNTVRNTTVITLVAVIFFGLYLFLVDRIWAYLLTGLNRLLIWLTGG